MIILNVRNKHKMSILDGLYWENEMKPKTNLDKLRQMNDKDLARWLTSIEIKILQKQPELEPFQIYKDWLNWLREEINNE